MELYILINILSLIFSCLALVISIISVIFICIRIRPLKSNIPFILLCNTYLTEITSSIMVIESCCRTIFAILNPSISFEGVYCQIRAYFLYVFVGNIMYSFVVQAFSQLFRVVFYHKRALRTLRVFTIAIIFQWIFVSFINLIFFPLHDFVYVPSEYRCLVTFDNRRGSLMVFLFTYIIPANLLFIIYFFIIRHVRQTNHAMQNRQLGRKRDLMVLKRIVAFFIGLQALSIPLAVLWLVYIITDNLVSSVYQLQSLNTAFSQFFMTIVITFGTPQMQEKLKWRRRQVHPVLRVRIQKNEFTERIQAQRF